MFPKKSTKPPKKAFTNEKIRAKAYQLWEKNKEQSEEENWNAAIKALERERRFRVLIGIWRWTGLGEKKGWDIVTSLSIPLIVFGGGVLFNYLSGKQQQEVAEQKHKDELLKTYLNEMKGFLLDEKHPLKDLSKNDESKSIARAITLTTLTQLNNEKDEQISKEGNYNKRKGLIMQFLFESDLIEFNDKFIPIVSLETADFTFANLERATLIDTNLIGANLMGANLERAVLGRAKLYTANLESANLMGANLERAYLMGANLKSANLMGANLHKVLNLANGQIKAACHWEKAIYTEAEWDIEKFVWTAKNAKANQEKINGIEQDKYSDPTTHPDCSIWKSKHN